MKKIRIYALIGEAGAGKDYALNQLFHSENYQRSRKKWHEIISCTTRPRRENERDDVNYRFLSDVAFKDQINDFLEWTEFRGWYYGTRYSDLEEDKINIGVFNPAGVRSLLKDNRLDVKVFWICADPKTRLLRQLNREEDPDVDEIVRRYFADKEDFNNIEFEVILVGSGNTDFIAHWAELNKKASPSVI